MVNAKILSKVLDERFGAREGMQREAVIIERYLKIRNGKETDKRMFLGSTYELSGMPRVVVRYASDAVVICDDEPRHLNTKEAPVEQYLSRELKTPIVVTTGIISETKLPVTVITFSEVKRPVYNRTWYTDAYITSRILSVYPKLAPEMCPEITELDRQIIAALLDCAQNPKPGYDVLVGLTNTFVDEKLGDFETEFYSRVLKVFAGGTTAALTRQLESDIEAYNNQISDLLQKINVLCDGLRDKEVQYKALQASPDDDNDAVWKFFKNHKNLSIYSAERERIAFYITDTITNYDLNELTKEFKNPRTYWGSLSGDYRKFVKYVLVERRAQIQARSMFVLDDNMRVGLRTHVNGTDTEFTLPHPHLNEYGCLGTNSTYLAKFNAEGDWDLAIEQAIAATKNININDMAVMRYLQQKVSTSFSRPFLRIKETGEMISPRDLIERIENEAQNQEHSGTENPDAG